MTLAEFFLLCFAIGTLWAIATLLLGGMHFGHGHGLHKHFHGGRFSSMVNPSCVAVFLAWSGGVGYLLTRYSALLLWLNVLIALAFGIVGAAVLGSFLNFLQKREKPLDPLDYDMVGVFGHVSSAIRPEGVGEILYVREGARRCAAARSEDYTGIAKGQEVIVTRYERGIAYVRTWEAMTQSPASY